MKSAQISKYGSSEVIEINQNTSEPTVSSGKVLVIIKAAGVNPVDWKIREGGMQQIISLQFPSILGIDFSGVISGGSGAFAEMALVNTGSIANKPKGLSHAEAAALPLVGVSAWKALMENIELSKDQKF